MKLSSLLFLALVFAGCSVQSTQTDMVRAVLPDGGSVDPDRYAWRMTFNGTQAIVYAVTVQDGIVFANRDDLQIGFDGWDVVLVTGMAGAIGDVRVRKQDGEEGPRTHVVEGVGEFEVVCEAPRSASDGWRTRCRYDGDGGLVRFEQRLYNAADGSILRIEAHIVPGIEPMVLEPFGGRSSG